MLIFTRKKNTKNTEKNNKKTHIDEWNVQRIHLQCVGWHLTIYSQFHVLVCHFSPTATRFPQRLIESLFFPPPMLFPSPHFFFSSFVHFKPRTCFSMLFLLQHFCKLKHDNFSMPSTSTSAKKSIIIMQTSNSFMFYYSSYFVVSVFLWLPSSFCSTSDSIAVCCA